MALRLPVYGARRCLRDGVIAAHEGRIEDALACMRGYFALRAQGMAVEVSRADAEAVMLAATCAAIRIDPLEIDAVHALLGESPHEWVVQARAWIETLRCAMRGQLPEVVDALRGEVSTAVRALGPSVLLVAAERDVDHVDEDAEELFRSTFGGELPAALQARVVMIQARASLLRGDHAAASSHLARMPADATPFHAFVAGLSSGRIELERRWNALADAERAPAAAFATSFAVGAPSDLASLLLEVCEGAPAAARSALRATLAGALIREGRAGEALATLDDDPGAVTEEKRHADAVPLVLRLAKAHALLALGRSGEALHGLVHPPVDPDERDVSLIAAVGAANDQRVRELLELEAAPAGQAARDAVIGYLATTPALPDKLPAWVELAPEEPDALYAWAIVQTRRGRGAPAIEAFERALALAPELASTGDGPDVARLLVGRDALQAGDLARAEAQLAAITSPRVATTSLVLYAMVLVRRAAVSEHVKLDENALGQIVRDLLNALPADQREHRAVRMLAKTTDDLRARWLLRQGRIDEARPIVDRLANDPSRSAFFAAVLSILDNKSLDDSERELVRAIGLPGSDRLLGVLLAEVRGARGDAHARVAALEAIRSSSTGDTLVDEALVAAYGGARRGLDAKRVAMAELRRTRGTLGAVLAAQLQDALRFEAPPAGKHRSSPEASRSGLRPESLANRSEMLLQLANERAAREPSRRNAIDLATQRFTRAIAAEDTAAALVAERDVLRACNGGAS